MAQQPTLDEIESKVSAIKNSLPASDRKQKLLDLIDGFCDESFEAGQEYYESENPPINEEKSNSEYVTEIFADCKTFEEFQTLYNEIRNLSYTYMK